LGRRPDLPLWACGWALGLLAIGSRVRLLSYAAGGAPVQTELFVWVLLGTIAGAFSACCAVLAGVKSVEQRLSRHGSTSATFTP
jgi:hypothetical protein